MAKTMEIVLRIVGTGLIGIGAFAAYGTVRMRLKTAQAHRWPTAAGTITSSEVETETGDHDERRVRLHSAAITYTYEVGGKSYESDQIELGGTRETNRPGEFERLVARYPMGKRVTVYYDPDDPATATLEPGALGGIFNMAMVAGGFVLVGGILVALTFWDEMTK
jgi:hypothetical protein